MPYQPYSITSRAKQIVKETALRSSNIHADFLEIQNGSLEQVGAFIEQQIAAASSGQKHLVEQPIFNKIELFNTQQMNEFATGSMARCFGPEFLVFEGRRYPRIPNGDLMLMSRVLEINGKRGKFDSESSIVVEYDVPDKAWFFRDSGYNSLPYSVMMEIALQPCGFLSAYLGTSLIIPNIDFYFRNLDGTGKVFADPDLRGKTIKCAATLRSTIISDDTIIQKFTFELTCRGEKFYQGSSIFGFFSPEAMAKQVGLDSGKPVLSRYEKGNNSGSSGEWIELNRKLRPEALSAGANRLPQGQMKFLDRVYLEINSKDGRGDFIYATRVNDPQAWFYTCHFHMDPVMPGSLGVEAILEALKVYTQKKGYGSRFKSPKFGLAVDRSMDWKYRGQILPTHQGMKLEIIITDVLEEKGRILVSGNASLWADTVRIYEIKQATISISEGD